ncbi:MAG: hypothetical protein ACRBCI_01915 [Cellvibrionaceae bacterium]
MNTALNHYPTTAAQNRRVTEVIIPQGQNSNAIVFPLVASLSKQPAEKVITTNKESSTKSKESSTKNKESSRWVTWITDRKPNAQQIHNMGASVNTLRIIHTKAENDCRWILWEALRAGNSHTVIADMIGLSDNDIKEMEAAAETGNCNGIITQSL